MLYCAEDVGGAPKSLHVAFHTVPGAQSHVAVAIMASISQSLLTCNWGAIVVCNCSRVA